jgi:hypothetical protein
VVEAAFHATAILSPFSPLKASFFVPLDVRRRHDHTAPPKGRPQALLVANATNEIPADLIGHHGRRQCRLNPSVEAASGSSRLF